LEQRVRTVSVAGTEGGRIPEAAVGHGGGAGPVGADDVAPDKVIVGSGALNL
jgi:hypothetical protein